jgi:ABC-type transport system involved in cytochrome c biogenesis permease subunit
MLSRVGVVCFASSYAIAWMLELARPWVPSRMRGAAALAWVAAGLLAQTLFLWHRAATAVAAPLSSEQDWFFVAAWMLVVVDLGLAATRPKVSFGLFLLPLALALIGAGAWWASTQPLARPSASRVWGTIHGVAILLATVAVLVGFVAGVMYLVQSRRLKRKWLAGGPGLPSLEWLEQANSRAIVASVVLLGVGIAAGMVLNLIHIRDPQARLPWTDPVVASTWLMFFWLSAAVVALAFYRPARRGRKVAYLTLVGFVFLVIMLAAGLLAQSRHWERGGGGRGAGDGGQNCKLQNESGQSAVGSRQSAVGSGECEAASGLVGDFRISPSPPLPLSPSPARGASAAAKRPLAPGPGGRSC